jgi:hypothetical protein
MPISQTLEDNWLQSAESCGSTKWLKQFIRFYVLELRDGTPQPRSVCE